MALHTYTPYEWKNAPDHKTTPLSADNLNHIEQGIKNAEDDIASVAADLTSISQTGSTASQAISAGTYFYLDGTLVRAKTAIANGATFTLNTNYEVVTDGALNESDICTLISTITNGTTYSFDLTPYKVIIIQVNTSALTIIEQPIYVSLLSNNVARKDFGTYATSSYNAFIDVSISLNSQKISATVTGWTVDNIKLYGIK